MTGGLCEGSSLDVAMDVVMDDARMDGVMRGFNRGLKMLSGQPFSSFSFGPLALNHLQPVARNPEERPPRPPTPGRCP